MQKKVIRKKSKVDHVALPARKMHSEVLLEENVLWPPKPDVPNMERDRLIQKRYVTGDAWSDVLLGSVIGLISIPGLWILVIPFVHLVFGNKVSYAASAIAELLPLPIALVVAVAIRRHFSVLSIAFAVSYYLVNIPVVIIGALFHFGISPNGEAW